MSDYISRADAIRVISEEYHNRGGNFDGLDAIRELETLPSKGGDAEILNEDFRPKYMQQCPNNGADLISRADAIEAVRLETSKLGRGLLGKGDILDIIEALPSADAVQGEWKCMGDCGVTECDQCGWSIEEYVGDYNFCPNCGARMKGGAE